jgi:hypothetical protein
MSRISHVLLITLASVFAGSGLAQSWSPILNPGTTQTLYITSQSSNGSTFPGATCDVAPYGYLSSNGHFHGAGGWDGLPGLQPSVFVRQHRRPFGQGMKMHAIFRRIGLFLYRRT